MTIPKLESVLTFMGRLPKYHEGAINFVINATPDDAKHLADIRSIEDVVLLVVDAQKKFGSKKCQGTAETELVSDRLSDFSQAFRDAGISIHAIYYDEMRRSPDKAEFYKFRFEPEKGDEATCKTQNSPFKSSNIEQKLKIGGKKTLLVCGFNFNACVLETVKDACSQGYQVYVLRDMCGNGDMDGRYDDTYMATHEMKQAGVRFVNAPDALEHLRHLKGMQHA